MGQNVYNPKLNISLVPSEPEAKVAPKVTTFILQKTAGGSATANEKLTDIDINTEDTLFGADSMMATAIREFRKINKVSRIDAIPVDDNGSAVDATGIVNFTGSTATASGNVKVYIGNNDRVYDVAITLGDAATAIGDALVTLITADSKSLVSAVNTTGSVALTAKNGGTQGNDIGIRIEGAVAGVTVALTAMASGATDPVITSLSTLIDEQTDIVTHIGYDYATFVTLLDDRFNSLNVALDGRLITATVDTKANIVTLANAENSKSLVILADKPVAKATKTGSAIFAMPYQRSVNLQAIRTIRLEDGQPVGDLLTTTASKDQSGGAHLSSLPLFNCKTQLPVIPSGEGYTESELADIKVAGGSVFGNNRANNLLITGAILTTYKTNVAGLDDDTYRFLEYVDTATAAREFILNSLAADYSQSRLSLGSAVAGHDIATIGRVRSSIHEYMKTLGGVDYVLIQFGVLENGKTVESVIDDNLDVSFDVSKGDINIETILPIMTQVRQIIAPLSIVFNVNEI